MNLTRLKRSANIFTRIALAIGRPVGRDCNLTVKSRDCSGYGLTGYGGYKSVTGYKILTGY